jgi:hypothetical protein
MYKYFQTKYCCGHIALVVSAATTTLCAAAKNFNLISCRSRPPAFCYPHPGDVTDVTYVQWARESPAECHHCLGLTLTGFVTGFVYAHVDLEERDEKEKVECVETAGGLAKRCVSGKWQEMKWNKVTRDADRVFRTKLNHHMRHAIKLEQDGLTERRGRLPLAVEVNGPKDAAKFAADCCSVDAGPFAVVRGGGAERS